MKPDAGLTAGGGALRLGPASRWLRRALRPIDWVVLEDVALDARPDAAGRLVAPTSARQVAEHLGLTPGAVARALARLRIAGVLTHARQCGPAGRFGLSAYVLGAVPGLDVIDSAEAASSPSPCSAPPHIDGPRAVDVHMVGTVAASVSDAVESARRSVHDDALAGAVDQLADEERARSATTRSAVKSRRRPASKPVVAQLSILDTTRDDELDDQARHP